MTTLSFQAKVPVFDANVGVGHRHDRISPFENATELLAEMERHGVGRALIYHVQGERLSTLDGNNWLEPWIKGNPELYPQWVVGATADGLDQLRQLHTEGKVTNVRLHNTIECRVPFVDWIYGELLEWLSVQRIPLWVSLADTPPVEIMETLRRYPDLVTVLIGAHYTHSLMVRPLLRYLPNAHLELSRYENLRNLLKLKEEFGPERFVYGSFYPRYAMGPMLFSIHHLGLNQSELMAFCSGNLERILGDQKK
tara:strand:+ start:1670 stop:2428 length:759 start_codon:yes stop_codon:yes gene_type:complete